MISLKRKQPPISAERGRVSEDGPKPSPNTLSHWLDPKNRKVRTPIGWVLDPSPSMDAFTEAQLEKAKQMVEEFLKNPLLNRTVMMNVVQIGEPAAATGFSELASFRVPDIARSNSTPLHLALDRMKADFGRLISEIREQGIDRTESVVIITTDGMANGCTQGVLDQSIREFNEQAKRWSVTNLVVGLGESLDENCLKALANTIPPLQMQQLNVEALMPFIKKLVLRASQSSKGQKIEVELPKEIRLME